MILLRRIIILLLICVLTGSSGAKIQSTPQEPVQLASTPTVPTQTDDGLDPINLILTGYAPSWWVAANLLAWGDSAYCSGPKTVNGQPYNYTLEHPDTSGLPCIGPRDHIRIWDMGYDPTLGQWSVASAHHEHTLCDPSCHHVIDSWNRAEGDAAASIAHSPATSSIANKTLGNSGIYQGVYFNGNATMIQLKPPSTQYPVVFNENGLGNETAWAVTFNGNTTSSTGPAIVFEQLDGTYSFNASIPAGFNASPASGTLSVKGGAEQTIRYRTPWTMSNAMVSLNGQTVSLQFNSNATIEITSIRATKGDPTIVDFKIDVLGAIGAVNVTIPKSIAPSEAIGVVYVNGTQDQNQRLTSDPNNYYSSFLVPFGTHCIEIQLGKQPTPYLEYVEGGAAATGVLVALVLVFRSRRRTIRIH